MWALRLFWVPGSYWALGTKSSYSIFNLGFTRPYEVDRKVLFSPLESEAQRGEVIFVRPYNLHVE